jgi:adenine C2-methylase RlmN of 23S rRNA A2503 and tRNA A37
LNVIPYNQVSGLPYQTPSHKAQQRFLEILHQSGINVQVRERKGDKIDAACGQLRRVNLQSVSLPQIGLTLMGYGVERRWRS